MHGVSVGWPYSRIHYPGIAFRMIAIDSNHINEAIMCEHTSFSTGNIPESCSVLWNNLTTINNTFNNVFDGIVITPFVYYDQNAKANGN